MFHKTKVAQAFNKSQSSYLLSFVIFLAEQKTRMPVPESRGNEIEEEVEESDDEKVGGSGTFCKMVKKTHYEICSDLWNSFSCLGIS